MPIPSSYRSVNVSLFFVQKARDYRRSDEQRDRKGEEKY